MSFFPGCQLAEEWLGWPERGAPRHYLVEPKLDGYRLSAVIDNLGVITYHCRDATSPEWAENLEHITEAIRALNLRGVMLDGEVMAKNWNDTSKLIRRKRSKMSEEIKQRIVNEVRFHLFDGVTLTQMTTEGFVSCLVKKELPRRRNPATVYDQELWRRRYWLENCVMVDVPSDGPLRLVAQFKAETKEELDQIFQELLDLDFEGVMIKDPNAPYVIDRHFSWQKRKPVKTVDMKIVGMVEGLGKHVGRLGALICETEDGTKVNVGGGFTDAQREKLWALKAGVKNFVIEVKMQDDKVATARHPVFVRFRDEKNPSVVNFG